ncbi:hypothetical protein C8J57DRAFT_1212398 [Mycena rebaudengoi]|nr:hypothetical protein C8J57DRAFT_1212398 [Mycena rebaudengoi]
MDSMDVIRNDDEEDLDLAALWDPAHWIACGKRYSDLPPIVEVARRNVVQTPTSIQRLLPPKSISILQLLCFDLPPVVDDELAMDIDHETYSDTEPTSDLDIAEILAFLALHNRRMLNQIVDTFGQAWFDGKKSISVSFNPEVVYPFWVLTYWGTMLDACEARDKWVVAQSWLGRTGKTEEEKAMKQTVLGLWSAAPWGGSLRDLGGLMSLDLANFFSSDYLSGGIVNAMLTVLSLRLTASGDHTALITNTTFATFIRLLLPIVDGVATGSISASGEEYLNKYGRWFQTFDHSHLYLVLYRPESHWSNGAEQFSPSSNVSRLLLRLVLAAAVFSLLIAMHLP